jgi:hypothetical protein
MISDIMGCSTALFQHFAFTARVFVGEKDFAELQSWTFHIPPK